MKKTKSKTTKNILNVIKESLEADKAKDIIIISLAGKTDIAENMVIASGRSARHVDATSDHLITNLKNAGIKGLLSEGRENNDWVLIDTGFVIINIFRPEVRTHYDLEKLWGSEFSNKKLKQVTLSQ